MASGHRQGVASRLAAAGVELVWTLTVLGVGLAVVFALLAVLSPGIRESGIARAGVTHIPVHVRYPDIPGPTVRQLQAPRLVGHDNIVLSNKGVTALTVFTGMISLLLVGSLAIFGLSQLRQFIRAIERGEPFAPANAVRLRRMAAVLAASGLLADVAQVITIQQMLQIYRPIVLRTIPGAEVGYRVGFSWQLYLGALLVLALAQAFATGARLQSDHDLTV